MHWNAFGSSKLMIGCRFNPRRRFFESLSPKDWSRHGLETSVLIGLARSQLLDGRSPTPDVFSIARIVRNQTKTASELCSALSFLNTWLGWGSDRCPLANKSLPT